MFIDNKDLTREARTEAASDFLTEVRDSDTIRAVVVLTNEVSTLRNFVKELERERNCAKCHVEDSEFCDEVNVALAALRDDVERLKTELAASLLKEGEAFRLGEKAVLGLMEEHQALVRNAAVERKEFRTSSAAGLRLVDAVMKFHHREHGAGRKTLYCLGEITEPPHFTCPGCDAMDLCKALAAVELMRENRGDNSRPLIDIPFPECAEKCRTIKHFGAGECEAICFDKFERQAVARRDGAELALEGSCPTCRWGDVSHLGEDFECADCGRLFCGKCGGLRGAPHPNVNACSCEGRIL